MAAVRMTPSRRVSQEEASHFNTGRGLEAVFRSRLTLSKRLALGFCICAGRGVSLLTLSWSGMLAHVRVAWEPGARNACLPVGEGRAT